MGHSEGSPKRKNYSNTGLTQEARKISNKPSNHTSKQLEKRTTYRLKKIKKNINDTKSLCFETENKIDKPLMRFTRKKKRKRDRTQINKNQK